MIFPAFWVMLYLQGMQGIDKEESVVGEPPATALNSHQTLTANNKVAAPAFAYA